MNELEQTFQRALERARSLHCEEVGIVIAAGDSLCRLAGLAGVFQYEMVIFDGGNRGMVMNITADEVSVFLLDTQPVAEGERATRTRQLMACRVSDAVLGRVLDAQVRPIDGQGELNEDASASGTSVRPLERVPRGIVDRKPIDEPLSTGIMVVDALVPIGKGQRELIIGNRSTGKTTLVLDTIINQKGKDVICIYVSIGQRAAHVARLRNHLLTQGALDYTVIIAADASESATNRYLAPYVGCTIAEHFQEQGRDVLIVYDDLSAHAVAYREMSLLMRRYPGREAYPGDVFYLHSRLLERAGRFLQGGSITALPIAEVQADDITAYIATNLISITDGQIFLDTKLFHGGIRPAVNIELSVSRVGGAAQTPAMKKVVRSLKLELAQYHELSAFAQFGSDLDDASLKRLERGAAIMELLKQDEHLIYPWQMEVLMLFLMRNNFLDGVPLNLVAPCATAFVELVRAHADHVLWDELTRVQDITPSIQASLEHIAQDVVRAYRGS